MAESTFRLGFYWREICGTSEDSCIEPDPDIAGIGVILAFFIIGYLTMILLTLLIILTYRRDGQWTVRNLLKPRLAYTTSCYTTSCYTTSCYATSCYTTSLRRPTKRDAQVFLESEQAQWKGNMAVLASTIFGLGDTQFATGVAICAAVFSKRDISGYHYWVCLELAWMPYISSSAALLATRTLLDSANSAKRVVRVLVMWCLFGLAVTLEARRNDTIGLAQEMFLARPYWDLSTDGGRATVVLLISTFLSAIIDTIALVPKRGVLMYFYVEWLVVSSSLPFLETPGFWPLVRHRCTYKPQAGLSGIISLVFSRLLNILFIVLIWLPLRMAILGLYWFFFEAAFTHTVNCGFFTWSAVMVFRWRRNGRYCMLPDDRLVEDGYGFGQVMAMTLLISPLISNADSWYGMLAAKMAALRAHRSRTMRWPCKIVQMIMDA